LRGQPLSPRIIPLHIDYQCEDEGRATDCGDHKQPNQHDDEYVAIKAHYKVTSEVARVSGGFKIRSRLNAWQD
jgi:hypothetical protein